MNIHFLVEGSLLKTKKNNSALKFNILAHNNHFYEKILPDLIILQVELQDFKFCSNPTLLLGCYVFLNRVLYSRLINLRLSPLLLRNVD